MNIVVADPDANDRASLGGCLSAAGHDVTIVSSGLDAIAAIERAPFSLVVTAWRLGDMTGFDLARMIKGSANDRQPLILMVSDSNDSPRLSEAVAHGVDDCVTKPFESDDLVARVDLILRRTGVPPVNGKLRAGPIILDKTSHKVTVDTTEVHLSPVEFRLLNFLMKNPGRVFTRRELLENVWERSNHMGQRTVDVHVRRLRAALEPHQCDQMLHTVRGFGYRFD